MTEVRHAGPETPAADRDPTRPGDPFGVSGDLAEQPTFRSLRRPERRGRPERPMVGVAVGDRRVDRLRECAHRSIQAGGEPPAGSRRCFGPWGTS
ncbi:MAG TPA: hypothetical protein VFD01_10065 [Candidatus Dormibacteraeota bacterium]|nr:hypothetical protein [Candidatus Dormibacteraeota bacterium]